MGRNMLIFVSDDNMLTEKVKSYGNNIGETVHVYTSSEWGSRMMDPEFRSWLQGDASLSTGTNPVNHGAKVLPFPGSNEVGETTGVRTINELESLAIEGAISEYKGNLTEAAKALGIGRATLYRKVKQYNIDPSTARKKRAA